MSRGAQPRSSFQARWCCDARAPRSVKRGLELLQPLAGVGLWLTQPGQGEKDRRVLLVVVAHRCWIILFFRLFCPSASLRLVSDHKGISLSRLIWPNKFFYCRHSGRCDFFSVSLQWFFLYFNTYIMPTCFHPQQKCMWWLKNGSWPAADNHFSNSVVVWYLFSQKEEANLCHHIFYFVPASIYLVSKNTSYSPRRAFYFCARFDTLGRIQCFYSSPGRGDSKIFYLRSIPMDRFSVLLKLPFNTRQPPPSVHHKSDQQ